MRPRLLDLFCGAGGAGMGFHRAGFEVVGVDIRPQPNYPFEFVQMDALVYLRRTMEAGWLDNVDAIHASPPCQRYAGITKVSGDQESHADLIRPTRDLLVATGLPYVIENVPDARHELIDPIYICGSMFDPPLDVKRHRYFEANWPLEPPMWPCRHRMWYPRFPVSLSHKRRGSRTPMASVVQVQGSSGTMTGSGTALRRQAMGMDWATSEEIAQAIPPAYTEFIGHQLLAHIGAVAA